MLKMLKSIMSESYRDFIVAGDDTAGRQGCAV